MPKLNDHLQKFKAGHFGFSATRLTDLGACEYTLVTIAVDASSSVTNFQDELEHAISEIIKSCKFSARADNLMIRLLQFNNRLTEIHGFKLLSQINLADYQNILSVGGMTSLYDATENSIVAMSNYGKSLVDHDFDVNGILFVVTDGVENNSKISIKDVRQGFDDVLQTEVLESLVSVLVGVNVNESYISDRLSAYKTEAGFTEYLEVKNADAKSLAKLAAFVSQSIGSQSKSLGTGQAGTLAGLTI